MPKTLSELPRLPLQGGALFVDNSMLELLQTCTRALEYNRLMLRVAAADKPSLNFGSAIHLALEHRYRTYRSDQVDYDCEEEQGKILTAYFEQHPQPVDDWRTVNWAIEVMRMYNKMYPVEAFQLLSAANDMTDYNGKVIVGAGEPLVELPFALPLMTYIDHEMGIKIPIIYTGRIDLPNNLDGAIMVMDHKTTSMLGSQFFEKAAMLAQLRGYMWAFERLTGLKVHGYTVNALRTKEPPVKMTSGAMSTTEIRKWWNESFQRQNFYKQPEEIEEWRQNTIALVNEFFYHWKTGYFPMKTSWCTVYGRCQYYEVCNLPTKDRGIMLSSNQYTDNTWTPLKAPSAPQV